MPKTAKKTAPKPVKKVAPETAKKTTDNRPEAEQTPLGAVLAAVEESRRPSENLHNMCLRFVRNTCWKLPLKFKTAREAYDDAHKHGDIVTFKSVNDVPVGAPVFSRSKDAGPNDPYHVFIACRWWHPPHDKPVRVFRSTDIKRSGEVDAVELDTLLEKWNHECLGYSKSLNGYRLPLK